MAGHWSLVISIINIILHHVYGQHIFMLLYFHIQYSQRHTMINHCDRRITHLGGLDISFVLLNKFSQFLLHLQCYLLSLKRHIKISKQIKQTKRYISITKKSDMSITVIYHAMSLTVLYIRYYSETCFSVETFNKTGILYKPNFK